MLESNPLIDAVHIGVLVLNEDLVVRTWNRWMAIHTGLSKDSVLGEKIDSLFDFTPKQLDSLKRRIKTAHKLKSPTFTVASVEKYLLPIPLPLSNRANFTHMQQDVTIAAYDANHVMLLIYDQTPLMESRKREENKSNELLRLISSANYTIEKLKAAEALLVKQRDVIYQQANYDQLTGLSNRHLFEDRLAQLIRESKRTGTPFALLFLDLDNFKQINDTFGHDIGDAVLVKAAQLLKDSTRESDILVRFGGDEFLALLNDVNEEGAVKVANKILKAFNSTVNIKSHSFTVGSSIGIALFPKHAASGIELVQKADKALYLAKSKGKNQATLYEKI
jgi:diguanylate cyclase (GGDEF)-like protein